MQARLEKSREDHCTNHAQKIEKQREVKENLIILEAQRRARLGLSPRKVRLLFLVSLQSRLFCSDAAGKHDKIWTCSKQAPGIRFLMCYGK
jgi:hypothetical protein